MSFKASYNGWCSECHEPIYQGDQLEWGDESRVVHADCLPEVEAACPRCFQIPARNGECGCDPE